MTDYINDADFDSSAEAVREHYRQAEPVIEAFQSLNDAPTAGFFGNSGWYNYQHTGEKVLRRATTLEIGEDYHDLIDDLKADENDSSWRSLYNITSWKDREAVYTPASVPRGEDFEQGAGLAGYADMRGFPLWVDLDLEDNDDGEEGTNWKLKRGDIGEDKLATVEKAQAEFITEFADFYGVETDKIAAFDSGGGAYIYGPAASTIPIAERYADDDGPFGDARSLIFREIRERMFAYATGQAANATADDYGFEGIESRVFERVSEAEALLSPDWMQNRNRQSKAPLSIHGDHDVVATPLRNQGSVDYRPTLVSEVDAEVIERTAKEAAKVTETFDPEAAEDMAESLIKSLFPEYADRETLETWTDILDNWLTEERERRRNEAHREAVERIRQRERLKEQREEIAEKADMDPDAVTVDDLIAALEITPSLQDVYDALEDRHTVDVREVVREHAADAFDTSDRGHEITFDPSWRKSGSGESCAIQNGENEFIDNKANSGGGPAFAYALGEGIIPEDDNAAAKTLSGRAWGEALDGLRSEGYDIPVYVPEAGATNKNGEIYEKTPHWAIVKAAVALEIAEPEDLVERQGEGDSSYMGLVAEDYNATLDALEERDIEHGRDRVETDPNRLHYGLVLDRASDEPSNDKAKAYYGYKVIEDHSDHNFLATFDGQLYYYENGRWIAEGKQKLRELGTELFGPSWGSNLLGEMKEQIRSKSAKRRGELGTPERTVAVDNGLLHVDTGELEGHSKEHLALNKLPVAYDPEAEAPRWRQFLAESVEDGMQDAVEEYLGYTLLEGEMPFARALLLVGGGSNGKSTFLNTVIEMLGEDNITGFSLGDLSHNEYYAAEMFGALANIDADVTGGIGHGGMFKKLTGGDRKVSARRPYGEPFDFHPTTKQLYSANKVPEAKVDDDAFFRRWLIVEFPKEFTDTHLEGPDKDPELEDKLNEEIPGILNRAVEGAQRLLEQGHFTNEGEIYDKRERWQQWGDTVDKFLANCIETGNDGKIKAGDLHSTYADYCRAELGEEPESQATLTGEVKKQDGVKYSSDFRFDGKKGRGFKGVTVTWDDAETESHDTNENQARLPQSDVMETVEAVIRTHQGQNGDLADVETVLDKLDDKVGRDRAERAIQKLEKRGAIHEPEAGQIELT